MGVKGLLTLLRSLPVPMERIEEGSTLHIDGAGWCFQLIQQLNETYPSGLPEYTLLGGLYYELDQCIRQEVDYLQNQLRLQLILYDDGSQKRMKEATAEKRCEDRNQQWCNLLNICMNQKFEKASLPMPKLSFDQFLATIADLGIPIVSCEAEADQEVALAVVQSNAVSADHRHFAYAKDSDFIAFANCPYIPFDSFTIQEEIILAPVYLRSTTSQLLELSESQFVDLCILMGNDYTVEVDRLEFLASCGIPPSLSHDTNSLISYIRKSKALHSSVPKVQKIIEFSRELYELKDLSKYPYDSSRFVDLGTLSKETRKHIENWFYSAVGTSTFSSGSSLGHIALKYLSEHKLTYPQFSHEHCDSVTEMLHSLVDTETQSNRLNELSISEILLTLRWKDVEAATLYQNVCMKLLDLVCKVSSDFEDRFRHPHLNYDGYLYFSVLHDRSARVAISLASSFEQIKISESPESSDLFPRNPYRNSAGDKLLKSIQRSATNSGVRPSGDRICEPGGAKVTKTAKVDPLPIDEYREEILRRIRSDRVIIIHGETG